MVEKKITTETLSGQVPAGLPEQFKRTVPAGFKIGHCLAAAAKLWIDLGDEVRRMLLTSKTDDLLVEIVKQIVDERIEAAEAVGQTLVKRLKRKPGQKG